MRTGRVKGWRALKHYVRSHKVATGVTLLIVCGLAPIACALLRWAVLDAVWQADLSACQRASGACWGVISEKYRIILLGRYPLEWQWRPVTATGLLLGLVLLSSVRRCWTGALPLAWLSGLIVYWALMAGGVAGLPAVETDRWGGLPLTILLSTLALALAFPLAILIALGRRSSLPAIRSLCALYVELIRSVPLVSVLFMASFMLPLLLPQQIHIDGLLRVLVCLVLFAAAYLAEVVRGGLQAVDPGQAEAAQSLGLGYWQTQRYVVLPQALHTALPAIVNNFIATFKDTSLVTIVSLYELTGSSSLALNSDADWRPYKLEVSLFVAGVYFVFCFALSQFSRRLERSGNRAVGAAAL